MAGTFDKALKRIREFTPDEGYNLVGVDSFEAPGEELYLIDHFATREEAEAAKARFEAENPGDKVHVYGK